MPKFSAMENINVNMEYITPTIFTVLSVILVVGALRYLNVGDATSPLTRAVDTCLSLFGLHRLHQGSSQADDFQNDENLVLDKYTLSNLSQRLGI